MILISLLLIGFIAWAVFITRYARKMIYNDLAMYDEIDPAIEERFKPFQRIDKSKWNVAEIYFCAIFLYPLRLLTIIFWLVFLLIFVYTTIGKDDTAYLNEFSAARRNTVKFIFRRIARLILFCCGFYWISNKTLSLGKVDPASAKSTKKSNLAPIIVSNHQSWLDIIYHISSADCPSFLSKIEVKSFPIISVAAKVLQSIFVNRTSETDRHGISDLLKERGELILSGKRFPSIVIFPEGTAANGRYLLSFKKGAFEPNLPIKIVLIEYPRQNLDINLDYMGQMANSFLIMCQFKNNIRITEFDQVIDPSTITVAAKGQEQWQAYADRVRSIMLKTIPNIQDSESGFRDLKEYEQVLAAKRKQLNQDRAADSKKKQ